jgi:DNA-binding response OmpR family regulator
MFASINEERLMKNPRLLILDDQIQYGRSLERALRREYDIALASNLAEGQERALNGAEIVLTDVRLDEANLGNREGLAFVRWLRLRNAEIPIIAMSAVEDSSLEKDALDAGASTFLRKPIIVSQLRGVLRQFVRNTREP